MVSKTQKRTAKGNAAFFVLQKDAKKTPKGRQANFVLHLVGNHFWTPKGRLCKKDGKKSWHLHLNVSDKTLEQQRLSFVSNVCHLEDFSCCRFFAILLVPEWIFCFIFLNCAGHPIGFQNPWQWRRRWLQILQGIEEGGCGHSHTLLVSNV